LKTLPKQGNIVI